MKRIFLFVLLLLIGFSNTVHAEYIDQVISNDVSTTGLRVGTISGTTINVTSTLGTISTTFLNDKTISSTNSYIGGFQVPKFGYFTLDGKVSGTITVSSSLNLSGTTVNAITFPATYNAQIPTGMCSTAPKIDCLTGNLTAVQSTAPIIMGVPTTTSFTIQTFIPNATSNTLTTPNILHCGWECL